ncbi:NPCBM/NEW2 domain-containing protein [Actinosynnema sp. NPDC059335]|uniref:NPCBM/NEW2 domain-containing protein n=1 Tax=Actinosynnema sp. NPDC059335 TaxID=3346804 RepID=UPI00366BF510
MDDEDSSAARGRGRSAVWLSAAGVAVLALGIAIGGALTPEPTATTRLPTSPPVPEVAPPTSRSTAPLRPGVTWLADLAPVDSSSIDDQYVESPWTATAADVRDTTYTKSLSATGAWCSTARLTFALDGKYHHFTAQVAIAADSLMTKELDFYVLVDDRRTAEFPNTGPTPQPVDVPVTGAQRLTIGVEPPADDPGACPGPERVAVWADPALA